MRTRALLLIFTLAITSTVFAQNAEKKWSVGPDFGIVEYAGDLGNFWYNFNTGYAGGGSLYRYLNPSFDAGLNVFYDHVDKTDENGIFPGEGFNFSLQYYAVQAKLKYKLANGYILKEDAFIQPFITAGLGANYIKSDGKGVWGNTNWTDLGPVVSATPGISFPIGKSVNLDLYTGLNFPMNADFFDLISNENPVYPAATSAGDLFLHTGASLRINFGKAKDSDKDGVPDKKDLCPDTPEGVAVDENGCPLDSDGDGIPDYLDECPDVAGLEAFNGCPDSDGDGVPDKDDECPDTPGLKIFNGCPDSDGDGVPDKDDRCPDTPKGWEVDKFGCPVDRDRDGIPDSEDDCPDEPGVAELKGCPWTSPALIAHYGLEMKMILFDFDKSNLRQSAMNTLGEITRVLENHQDFGVHLTGHTDWTGTEKYNLGLSDRRAASAKKYLISKGIHESRIKTAFFGEEQPAATNKTSEGRQLNRRVDYEFFKIK